jgi:hypothetical protein
MKHTKCPECQMLSVMGGQPHLIGCSKPPPVEECHDCKGTGVIDTGIGPMVCDCQRAAPACTCMTNPHVVCPAHSLRPHGARAVSDVVAKLKAKLDAHPAAVQAGSDFIDSPKMHTILARARIEDLKARVPHDAVKNAIDHALEAFDRYAEQEGLT